MKTVRKLAAGIALFFCFPLAHAENINMEVMRAQDAYREKKYIEAFESYKKAASLGDSTACVQLGIMYENGEGVGRDMGEAVKWYEQALDRGSAAGAQRLVNLFYSGIDIKIDANKLMTYYARLAETGDSHGYYMLGILSSGGQGMKGDSRKAVELYRKAVSMGNSMAMNALGGAYSLGDGVRKDHVQAYAYFKLSQKYGDRYGFAQENLEKLVRKMTVGERDEGDLLYEKLLLEMADNADIEARHTQDAQGDGDFEKNNDAAGFGDSDDCIYVGDMYEISEKVKKEACEAIKKELDRADQEVFLAQDTYRKKKYAEAFESYKKAADLGNPTACFQLGIMYENGEGVNKNINEAIKWYEKAMSKGSATGAGQLANLFYDGTSVPKDVNKAVAYYTRAGELGDSSAYYTLGLLFSFDSSIRDLEKAANLFRKAVSMGNPMAMNSLGVAYLSGNGVRQSNAQAYAYFKLARRYGDRSAQENLDKLAQKMTDGERDNGDSLYENLLLEVMADDIKQ
ncbi:MAG: sel1 repeat family protein [Candidatus Accumulibacter sp.]|nr:sel1 repeat family protein [Accumulibacter sp.]